MGVGPLCECMLCKDIIQSKHQHDFVRCSCGKSFVDGGDKYLRCGGFITLLEDNLIKEDNGRIRT